MQVRLRAATRSSPLALWQTDHIARLVIAASATAVDVIPVTVSTTGDRQANVPIRQIGGKGVFVKEVQAAVLNGRADIAVHSAKDMPSVTPPGLVLAAVPARGDPRDALVGGRLAALPYGATVATGSVRRQAQLAALRPDLEFAELRGNIATRLRRSADFDAIVMAAAALDRLGIKPDVVDILPVTRFVPQAGQGAIAVECRADDHATRAMLATIEHSSTRRAVDAERAFLTELGGDCDLPAGAHATPTNPTSIANRKGPGDCDLPAGAHATPATPSPTVSSARSNDATSGGDTKPGYINRGDLSASRGDTNPRNPSASPDSELFRHDLELTGLLASVDGQVVLRETRRGSDPEGLGRGVARYLLGSAAGHELMATLR